MSYETYLHRSFDYQLSPVPSTIIDWANTRRAQRTLMPSSSPGGAAAATPLAESTQRKSWVVTLSALERAARLEAALQERQHRQQRVLQQQQQQQRHQQQQSSQGVSGAAGPSSAPVLSYYVDDTNPRDSNAATAAAAGGQRTNNMSGAVGGYSLAAKVAYPTDGALYAASTPEGEMLSLPNPFHRGCTSGTAASGTVNGAGSNGGGTPSHAAVINGISTPTPAGKPADGTHTASVTSHPPIVLGSSPAAGAGTTPSSAATTTATVVGAAGGPGAAPPSTTAPANPVVAAPHGLGIGHSSSAESAWATASNSVSRAITDLQRMCGDVRSLNNSADAVSDPSLLAPWTALALSDYVWSSYGSAPLWRRGTFSMSAGVYAAFGFTQAHQWELREVRSRQRQTLLASGAYSHGSSSCSNTTSSGPNLADLSAAGIDGGASNSNNINSSTKGDGNNTGGFMDGEGSASALLADARETQQLHSAKGSTAGARAPAKVEVGEVTHTRAVRVMNVAQLEWFWARLRWQGVLNVRLLPAALHARVPLCEYVMRTPWTEWSVQSDALVLNWSGFLTLYQQRTPTLLLARERLFQEQYGPALKAAEEAAREAHTICGDGDSTAAADGKQTAKDVAKALVDRKQGEKLARQQREREAKKLFTNKSSGATATAATGSTDCARTSTNCSEAATTSASDSSSIDKHESKTLTTPPGKNVEGGTAKGDTSSASNDAVSAIAVPPLQQQQQQQHVIALTTQSRSRTPHWWALRHLKIGAGIAVKNDLASGINLYWGCSGQTGRGLTFSGHIDVLRRMCCAVSASHGALDLSVRLRVNLITYHGTSLDAGLCCRPWASYPNAIVRVSTAATGRCLGLQIDDVTHALFSKWIATHAEERVARKLAGHPRQRVSEPAAATVVVKAAVPSPIRAAAKATDAKTGGVRGGASATEVQRTRTTEDGSANAEGGWISFGWASSAWSYLRGGHNGREVDTDAQRPLEGEQGQHRLPQAEVAAATCSSPVASRAVHFLQTAPRQALDVPKQWASRVAQGLTLPPEVRERAVATGLAVRTASVRTWRSLRHLDWLEALLDGAHVDVSLGLVRDPKKAGSGFSSFLVVSAH